MTKATETARPFTWVVDKTGLNTIHRTGCQHIRLNKEIGQLASDTIGAAMVEVAVANIDGFDPDVDQAGDWVAMSPCVTGAMP